MKLRIGEKGDLVRDIQNRLKELGYYPGPTDGIFSHNTKEAVFKFQKKKNLATDGIIGPNTLKALGFKTQFNAPKSEREIRRGVFTPRRW